MRCDQPLAYWGAGIGQVATMPPWSIIRLFRLRNELPLYKAVLRYSRACRPARLLASVGQPSSLCAPTLPTHAAAHILIAAQERDFNFFNGGNSMLRGVVFCLSCSVLLWAGSATAEPLPSTAKQATVEEFKAFACVFRRSRPAIPRSCRPGFRDDVARSFERCWL